jgi:putative AlgH/UPF0301 family transcriptional regulator
MAEEEKPSAHSLAGHLLVGLPNSMLAHLAGIHHSVILVLEQTDGHHIGVDLTCVDERWPYESVLESSRGFDLLADRPEEDRVLLGGGMCEAGFFDKKTAMTVLHETASGPPEATPVENAPFIAYSFSRTHDILVYYRNNIHPRNTRLIIGYSGWGPGQLEAELGGGQFYVAIPATEELLFNTPRGQLWDKCADIAGIDKNPPALSEEEPDAPAPI